MLHNATEHLIDIAGVFAQAAELLRPGGLLIFSHHNYYAWNGHHFAPKSVDAIDSSDEKQRKVLDWAHLDLDPELQTYLATRLNRITRAELRKLTEEHYRIEEWLETESSQRQGIERLTDEIVRKYAPLTREDLATQTVFCVARVKPRRATS